jgi:hypothetical protein
MSRGPDAATLLERALLAAAASAGCPLALVRSEMERWASATFTGARHVLVFEGPAVPALDRWLVGLAEAEFALRGHLVADLHVARMQRENGRATLSLEALTVEER